MRKVKPTQKDLAYIWEGFNSIASAGVAASKLAFCVRGYKAHARDVWQDTQAYRRHHTEMARECLIDARYWQAALIKYAKPVD